MSCEIQRAAQRTDFIMTQVDMYICNQLLMVLPVEAYDLRSSIF